VQLDSKNITPFLYAWHKRRQMARTDLLFLCNHVLGFKDVSLAVHGPIMEAMQGFAGWSESHKTVSDFNEAMKGKFFGSPLVPFQTLEGSRKNLILFPRGHLKSTVATIAHSIQWILNYPNIRILVTTATEDLARDFLLGIKSAFTNNETMRLLFPEFCTQGELGSGERFTIPCRNDGERRFGQGGKEPTIRTSTVGSAITGYHGDVQKSDDLVEKQNSSTPRGIEDVKWHFGNMHPLLETYANPSGDPLVGWVDLIGTPWDFSDLYQTLQDAEDKLPVERRSWNIVRRSAAPNWPEGPYLWPERVGYKALKAIEDDPTKGPAVLSAQYLMNPIVAGQGLIESEKQIVFTPRKHMEDIVPRLSLYAALDLAGMDGDARGSDNDYSCLTVGGFNRDGLLYVPFILHGRPTVEEVIDWVFQVFAKYPQLIKLKMEKEAHLRVLLPFLKKEMSRRGVFLPIDPQPRNNQQSKKDKIRGLRPWFVSGDLRFADDLPCRTHLITEVKGFPKFRHDDILDTLCDIMHEGRGINLGVMGREKTQTEQAQSNYLANPTPLAAMAMKADQFFNRNEDISEVNLFTGWG
jgi:predicted phage terminase large subunit-like protein